MVGAAVIRTLALTPPIPTNKFYSPHKKKKKRVMLKINTSENIKYTQTIAQKRKA